MKSTDIHINHPNKVNSLDLNKLEKSLRPAITVKDITQAEYDVLGQYDETVIYIITDSPDHHMYLGSKPISDRHIKLQYFIGYNPESMQYQMYANERYDRADHLHLIAAYKNSQDALDALTNYSYIGGHDQLHTRILSCLDSYLKGITGLNDAIISIIAVLGYKDDSDFQYLHELSITYEDTGKKDISTEHRAMLHNLKRQQPSGLVSLYSDIYDIFVKNKMFKRFTSINDISSAEIKQFEKDVNSALGSYKNR